MDPRPLNELRPPLKLAACRRSIQLTGWEGAEGETGANEGGNKTLLVESVNRENSYLRASVVAAAAVYPILST